LNYNFKYIGKRQAVKSKWVKSGFDLVKGIFEDLVMEWWLDQ